MIKHIHEVDVRVVGAVIRAEVLVHIAVTPILRAHVIEVIARRELAPILKDERIARLIAFLHCAFKAV